MKIITYTISYKHPETGLHLRCGHVWATSKDQAIDFYEGEMKRFTLVAKVDLSDCYLKKDGVYCDDELFESIDEMCTHQDIDSIYEMLDN